MTKLRIIGVMEGYTIFSILTLVFTIIITGKLWLLCFLLLLLPTLFLCQKLYWKEVEGRNKLDKAVIRVKTLLLKKITDEFPFIEYYPHTDCDMYKIRNEYTDHKEHKIVLCKATEGIEKALNIALKEIKKRKRSFESKDKKHE